jgi:hypothetical protein
VGTEKLEGKAMAGPVRTYQERSALYYPYIHVRSENWLKSTLLAFQRVDRIVPYPNTLRDEEAIQPYITLRGADGKPLLHQAEFQTKRVADAQRVLFQRLKEKEAELVERFSEDKVDLNYLEGEDAFQIHRGKILDYNDCEWLIEKKLAWNSRGIEERDIFNWLTVHPNLGSAIMSVLALSVAKQDGSIVTPSQHTHNTLLGNSEKQILAKLLDVPLSVDEQQNDGVAVQEMCQLIVLNGIDMTVLKPEDIQDMILKGGTDLRRFYGMLSGFSENIPPDLDEEMKRQRLDAKTEEVLEAWRSCTSKLPQLGDAVKDATVDKGLEKAVDLVKESLGTHFATHVLGGVPGIILAIAVNTTSHMLRGHETPYRYLNRINKLADKRIGALYTPQWRKLAS